MPPRCCHGNLLSAFAGSFTTGTQIVEYKVNDANTRRIREKKERRRSMTKLLHINYHLQLILPLFYCWLFICYWRNVKHTPYSHSYTYTDLWGTPIELYTTNVVVYIALWVHLCSHIILYILTMQTSFVLCAPRVWGNEAIYNNYIRC